MFCFRSILQIWIILIGFGDTNDLVNLGICKHEFKFTCRGYCRFTLRLLCNNYQWYSSRNLVSRQLKLCNIFIFGMAYCVNTVVFNSKTPPDNEIKFCHFNFSPLRHILHTLTMLIVLMCCHGSFCFQCLTSIFGMKK